MFPSEGLFGALSAYPSEIKQASKLKFSGKKHSISGPPIDPLMTVSSQQRDRAKRTSNLAVTVISERSQERAIKYTAIKSINLENSPDSMGRLQTEQAYKATAPASGRMATMPDDTRLRNVAKHSIDLVAADDSIAEVYAVNEAPGHLRASNLRNSHLDDGNESNYESAQEDDEYRYGD